MPLNLGYMAISGGDETGEHTARVYYDPTQDPSGPQQLINGPRGWCLDVTNTIPDSEFRVWLGTPDGDVKYAAVVPQGDPAEAQCLTAMQMASLGFLFRRDVSMSGS